MVALHDVLVVLEDNLDEGPVVGPQDRRVRVYSGPIGSLGDASQSVHSVYLEVVGQLHGRVGCHKGHAVEGVPLLSVHLAGRAG